MLATPKSLAAAAPSLLQPATSFASEIQSMMHGFGDCSEPLAETAAVLEEVVHQQMTEVLFQASDVALRRGASTVTMEDLLFLMRRSPIKLQRLVKYLAVKDLSSSLSHFGDSSSAALAQVAPQASRRVKRARDFLLPLDSDGLLERALNDELYDDVRMSRLRRMDRLSRDLDEKRYALFTQARQVNFVGQKMRQAQKFSDWLLLRAAPWMGDLKVEKAALEVFSYLAYETVGQFVELALLVRKEMEADETPCKTVNAAFPMVQFSAVTADAAAGAAVANTPSAVEESPQLRKRLKSGALDSPAMVATPATPATPGKTGSGFQTSRLR